MIVYIVTGIMVGLLGVASIIAMAIGLLSAFGLLRLDRCGHCGHLAVADSRSVPQSCMYCRHERLFHPIASLHHAHQPIGRG